MPTAYPLSGLPPLSSLRDGTKLEATVANSDPPTTLLVIKAPGRPLRALSPRCTHYGAPLVNGVLAPDGSLTCPWHGACFDGGTGDVEDAPGLNALESYAVTEGEEGEGVVVWADERPEGKGRVPVAECSVTSPREHVVVVGGGSGAFGTIEALRENGYAGRISLVTKTHNLPLDRTKISKALIDDAAKLQLRPQEWYTAVGVDVHYDSVSHVDFGRKVAMTEQGHEFPYSKLVLATGGTPRRLPLPGFNELANVFTVREVSDAAAIRAALGSGGRKRVAIIGSSFIGLETAIATAKEHEVTVVGMEEVPLAGVLGPAVGRTVQKLVEGAGVRFRLGTSVAAALPATGDEGRVGAVQLPDGSTVAADVVILGVGIKPATEYLAHNADVALKKDDQSVPVTGAFEIVGVQDAYAVGDIATFPYGGLETAVRIEHWNVAQNAGRNVGRAIAHASGDAKKKQPAQQGRSFAPRAFVPVFWSALTGQLRYCGTTAGGIGHDDELVRGDLARAKFAVFYTKGDAVVAVATMGMDPVMSKSASLMRRGRMPDKAAIAGGADVLREDVAGE